MKTKDLRELSDQELEQRITEEQADLSRLTFQKAVASLENPLVIRQKRRDIARMKTLLRQRTTQS